MAAKKNGILLVLVVVILGAAVAAGGWYWMTWGPGAGDGNQAAASDAPLTGVLPASANAAAPTPAPTAAAARPLASTDLFTRSAVIEDANGYTNVRSGPSTVAPAIARVSAGEVFATYEQGGDWWRVRTEGGLIGYMPRSRIRLQGGAPILASADAASSDATGDSSADGGTAAQPRRQRPRSRIVRKNSENMRLFCQNAGRGTPPCRRFRALGGR